MISSKKEKKRRKVIINRKEIIWKIDIKIERI